MSDADTTRNPVERLAEEFLARYRRGERPSVHEYTAKYPALAEEIRELLPALVVMEEAGQEEIEAQGAFTGRVTADGETPKRLGEYRILREVGRGGMGVVYEAVQETLGRHVALKVLPFEAAADLIHRKRFQREARAAARLHHTNIVPVFDVGEHQGVHYYAMQFIQGQALDEVLVELKRLRRSRKIGTAPNEALPGLAASLAESLQSGQFAVADDLAASPATVTRQAPLAPVLRGEGSGVRGSVSGGSHPLTPNPSPPEYRGRGKLEVAASASRNHAASGFSTDSSRPYHRSVARIGRQVAEALAYAHTHKVLHRDIKPSNLLLDSQGTVWITDFGLAWEEGEDLTRTGDVVGTLRYMAPERLGGDADARSDIYSLGLTLYELATLRPAFTESDRLRLVQRITQVEPAPPRKLDPHIPRDLETIILKAIAKETPRRYPSAADMAEDLGRFLDDRPILARRNSYAALAGRWIRRNPGWAATLGVVLGLLLVLAVGGLLVNVHLRTALNATQQAESDKTEQLWQTLVERAAAKHASGRVGQRFETLDAIRKAAAIRPGPELRDEALAALVLPDAEVAREWEGCTPDTIGVAFNAAYTRYVTQERDGSLFVYQLDESDAHLIARLPNFGKPPFHGLWMSPDGRFVAYGHSCPPDEEGTATGLRLWKLDEPEPTIVLNDSKGGYLFAAAFESSGRRFAVGHADGTITVWDPETGQEVRRLKVGIAPYSLAFHPREPRLAVIAGDVVRFFCIEDGRESPPLPAPKGCKWLSGVAWHPDGRLVATAGSDGKIRLYDAATQREVMTPWPAVLDGGTIVAFNHAGDRLISVGWGPSRVWDVGTGRLLLTLPGAVEQQFSPDDRLLGHQRDGRKLRLWRLAPGRELRMFRPPDALDTEQLLPAVADDEGQWLAAQGNDKVNRLRFFPLGGGLESASVPLPFDQSAEVCGYLRAEGWLTQGGNGLLCWPTRRSQDTLLIGPPRRLGPPSSARGVRASDDGAMLVIPYWTGALVLDRKRPGWRLSLGPQHDVRMVAISPDCRWVATVSWFWDGHSNGVRVWDARTGELAHDFPLPVQTQVIFSPDGKWLGTAAANDARLWEVGTWREKLRTSGGGLRFSPDGKLLAITERSGVIALLETETGRTIARLTGPGIVSYYAQSFTADGSRLIAYGDPRAVLVWDLRTLRKELAELGLDWQWSAFPESEAPTQAPASSVRLDAGFVVQPFAGPADQSVAVYTLALAATPLSADLYLYRGLAYGQLGNHYRQVGDRTTEGQCHQAAIADYTRFLTLAAANHPRRTEALARRIGNHRASDDPQSALADLELLLKEKPTSSDWNDELAASCDAVARHFAISDAQAGYAARALPVARHATELEPYSWDHHHTLGAVLYRLGRYQEAIPQLSHARPDNHAWPFESYFLAMCYQKLGQHQTAKEWFERAKGTQPGFSIWPTESAGVLTALRAEASRALGTTSPTPGS
jgi:serine/threonine protein kinase/WD40 repeat protein